MDRADEIERSVGDEVNKRDDDDDDGDDDESELNGIRVSGPVTSLGVSSRE